MKSDLIRDRRNTGNFIHVLFWIHLYCRFSNDSLNRKLLCLKLFPDISYIISCNRDHIYKSTVCFDMNCHLVCPCFCYTLLAAFILLGIHLKFSIKGCPFSAILVLLISAWRINMVIAHFLLFIYFFCRLSLIIRGWVGVENPKNIMFWSGLKQDFYQGYFESKKIILLFFMGLIFCELYSRRVCSEAVMLQ